MCIICKWYGCKMQCKNSNNEEGNLSIHAFKVHEGQSIYLGLETSDVYLISYPKAYKNKAIY